jgi:XTP/dITP diphosphohydrolase
MARLFKEDALVLATHNPGKVSEIKALFQPYSIKILSASALGLPEPVEDGTTFVQNAIIKAKAAAIASGYPALSDDSGLCVHDINNQPGVLSARWAGADKNFNKAMSRIWELLHNIPDPWDAHFVCALALVWPDGHVESFEGKVFGEITWPPRGDKGFGYDPIFIPLGEKQTFAEMNAHYKHSISHRAEAFDMLTRSCFPNESSASHEAI